MMQHTILLVDDEMSVTDALKRALRRAPYRFLSATSAREALDIMAREHIDVVVSDEMMPGMRGSELLGLVCDQYPNTMRIMLTGHADLETALRAINDGHIYRFLIKPCSEIELTVAIRQAIQHKDLMNNSRRLLKSFKRQRAVLQELEMLHPGITDVSWDSAGAIEISEMETDTDIDALIERLNEEATSIENIHGSSRSKQLA